MEREVILILDICLLGTGGMMPLPYRWLTSLMARYNGTSILIDCGEGTQIAMKEKGWSPKPIDIMRQSFRLRLNTWKSQSQSSALNLTGFALKRFA